MAALASLRKPIDDFFDHVTVNDPDPAKRERRLNLLHALPRRGEPRRGFLEDRRLERSEIVAGRSGSRGSLTAAARRRVALAPFLLAASPVACALVVRFLELAAAVDLAVVARLPFAAAAGGQEDADQQAEQEDEARKSPTGSDRS